MFGRKRFAERGLHHPVASPEPCDVLDEQIVLHEAAILRLVLLDNGGIIVQQECWAGEHGAAAPVQCSLRFDDLAWEAYSDVSVERAVSGGVPLRIVVVGDDLSTEEACCTSGGVGEQGLFLREFKRESLVQEGLQARVARFCFLCGSHKSQEPFSAYRRECRRR